MNKPMRLFETPDRIGTYTSGYNHAIDDYEKYHNEVINRKEVFDCVVPDDLPDGAYLVMASEFGLEPEDLIEEV